MRRARVLVVDDEPSTVDVARAHLEADLAEVVAAASHKTSHDNYTALVVWTRPA